MSDWYRLDAPEVLQQLGSDPSYGLSATEASRRLKEYGAKSLSNIF
jgi:P-type Ca2+ transporter type 2C